MDRKSGNSADGRGRRRFLSAVVLALVLLPQPFVSCQVETPGETISFMTAVQGTTSSGADLTSFETAEGWRVELDHLYAVFGPIYFYEGDAMTARSTFGSLSGVAAACPCHAQYDYGTVLGEVLEQYAVDLLATDPTSTGEVQGESGTCKTAELHMHPPGAEGLAAGSTNEQMENLDGFTISFEGTAIKDAVEIPFSGSLDIPDEGTMRIIQNIEGDEAVELDENSIDHGTLVLQVLVDGWFGAVDFSSLEETDDDGIYLFSEGTQAQTALLQAVRNRYSYGILWRES